MPESLKSDDMPDETHHASRGKLLYRVVLFQFKLVADGVRDLLLSPLSILASILGLIIGGKEPDKYLNRLMRFGRRSDIWINLFEMHKNKHTSDAWIAPLEEKVKQKISNNINEQHWVTRSSSHINKKLDKINAEYASKKRESDSNSTKP